MTSPATVDAPTSTPANPRSRVLIASMIGTTVEFYDFYAYATAAVLVFPQLFFPKGNDTVALLSSFAVFGAAMVARPIGAMFFGHLGDRLGRKTTLVISLLTMGIATVLIGCLPTYGSVGWLATLLLVIMRIGQGFALGGEWSGAALVATENAPRNKRAVYGTFPQLGAPLGFIIANGIFLIFNGILGEDAFASWGWRIPFLFSAVMVAVGLWVRLKLVESNAFQKAEKTGRVQRVPLAAVFRSHWREVILGTFYMLATYGTFYLMTTFSLTYGTKPTADDGLGYPFTHFTWMLIVAIVFFGIFTMAIGPVAERFGRRRTLIWVTVAIIVFGLLWVPILDLGSAGVWLWLIIGLSLMGLTFGPMGALLPELFPTHVRYTGSGVAYNVSSILGAAVAPFIAVALWTGPGDGSIVYVGVYLAVMGVLTLIALLLGKETKHVALEDA